MPRQISIIFVLGPPGAGKGTLSARLTQKFAVQHISVGDLLRSIMNDTADPQAEVIAPLLNKQELIDGNILVPLLAREVEKVGREEEKRVILVDGFPRNLAQQREFEKTFPAPRLVLLFDCLKDIAKQRYLTRNLKGREADDQGIFEKRYKEYTMENEAITSQYREQDLLLELDTSEGLEETWERICDKLAKDDRWCGAIRSFI
ncbi:hypothetical protein B7494_g4879 [Chlorociboria aeruginascens]|nr:hypothetical protein B7494_g4879 [Chlorociboria aeruginascens]